MTDEALAHLHKAIGALNGLDKRIKARIDIKRAPEAQIARDVLAKATDALEEAREHLIVVQALVSQAERRAANAPPPPTP